MRIADGVTIVGDGAFNGFNYFNYKAKTMERKMSQSDEDTYTKETVMNWMLMAHEGNMVALHRFMIGVREFVLAEARSFFVFHPDEPQLRDELIAVGLEGAMKALVKIPPQAGCNVFNCLSWWIRQSIRHCYKEKHPEMILCCYKIPIDSFGKRKPRRTKIES